MELIEFLVNRSKLEIRARWFSTVVLMVLVASGLILLSKPILSVKALGVGMIILGLLGYPTVRYYYLQKSDVHQANLIITIHDMLTQNKNSDTNKVRKLLQKWSLFESIMLIILFLVVVFFLYLGFS